MKTSHQSGDLTPRSTSSTMLRSPDDPQLHLPASEYREQQLPYFEPLFPRWSIYPQGALPQAATHAVHKGKGRCYLFRPQTNSREFEWQEELKSSKVIRHEKKHMVCAMRVPWKCSFGAGRFEARPKQSFCRQQKKRKKEKKNPNTNTLLHMEIPPSTPHFCCKSLA